MEKEKLNTILKAVANAFSVFSDNFKYGKTSDELFEPFLAALKDRLGEYDILYDYIWGKDSLNIGGVSKGYIPKDGDSVIMDISVGKDGVWCDVTRTFFVGGVSDKQTHIFELIKESIRMGEKVLKVGACAGDIHKALNEVYERDGKQLVHHAGHKIGSLAVMEPRFVPNNQAKIEETCFCAIESGCYEEFGIRLENNYLVSDEKVENLFENLMSLDIKEYVLYGKKY